MYPSLGDRDHAAYTVDEVFDENFVFDLFNRGAAFVAVTVFDFLQIFLNNGCQLGFVGKDPFQFLDERVKRLQAFLDLLPFETRQTAERHIDDGLRLRFAESEARLQLLARIGHVCRRADDLDYLVNMVNRNFQAFIDVRLALGTVKLKLRAPADDVLLMTDIVIKHLPEVEHLRLALDERKHIDCTGILKLGIFVQQVEYNLPHWRPF